MVTEPIDGVHPDLPVLRDPDGYTYFKEEVGGLVVGGFEPEAKPWVAPDKIPYPFEFQLLAEDWEHFSILMDSAMHADPGARATPASRSSTTARRASPRTTSSSSARRPSCANFFVGAGFNSVGIACAGGAGRALAEWIVTGEPDHGPDRGRHPPVRPVQRQRAVAARPGRRDPRPALRDAVAEPRAGDRPPVPPVTRSPPAQAAGASFGSRMGWERANFFAPPGERRRSSYSWGKQNWLPWSAAEQRAARTAVAVFDQTSFSKYLRQRARRGGRPAVAVHRRRGRAARARSTPACSTTAAPTSPTSP